MDHDQLLAALKCDKAPTMEYFLYGSVKEEDGIELYHRLHGLCDNCKHEGKAEKFYDHVMVYILSSPGVEKVTVRVKRAHDRPDHPCSLRYTGKIDNSLDTKRRECLNIATSPNVAEFLKELGFTLDFEYAAVSYVFLKGNIKITASRISKMTASQGVKILQDVEGSGDRVFVEISELASPGDDHIAKKIQEFADNIRPMVDFNMEEVDLEHAMCRTAE